MDSRAAGHDVSSRRDETYILSLSVLVAVGATLVTYIILGRITRRGRGVSRNAIEYLRPRARAHTTAGT